MQIASGGPSTYDTSRATTHSFRDANTASSRAVPQDVIARTASKRGKRDARRALYLSAQSRQNERRRENVGVLCTASPNDALRLLSYLLNQRPIAGITPIERTQIFHALLARILPGP